MAGEHGGSEVLNSNWLGIRMISSILHRIPTKGVSHILTPQKITDFICYLMQKKYEQGVHQMVDHCEHRRL